MSGCLAHESRGRGRFHLAAPVLGAFCGLLAVKEAVAQQPSKPATGFAAMQQQIQEVFEKCRPAVVRIQATDSHGKLSGTGFFIDPNGTLFTCYSAGGETRDIEVTFQDQRYPAKAVFADLRSGVAILKIDAETPFLTCGSSRELTVASPVLTIGYAMDLPVSPSFGVVGGLDIKYLGRYFATTHIRANVPVQRGQGGAPLLDLKGQVVGMLVSSLDQGSASFALPIEAAEKVRRDFVRFHEVHRGWLGVEVGTREDNASGSTAEVKDLLPGSPAEKAGLQQGDVLLAVGDRRISKPQDVLDASFYLTADDDVDVRVLRDAREMRFTVVPSDGLERQNAAHLSGLEPPLSK